MNTPAVTGTKLFEQNSVARTTYRPKWHNFDLVCISSMRKVTRLHKAVTVANNTSLCSTILVVFLEFTSVDRAEISYMNTPQNSSRQPSQPGCWAHLKRPLLAGSHWSTNARFVDASAKSGEPSRRIFSRRGRLSKRAIELPFSLLFALAHSFLPFAYFFK